MKKLRHHQRSKFISCYSAAASTYYSVLIEEILRLQLTAHSGLALGSRTASFMFIVLYLKVVLRYLSVQQAWAGLHRAHFRFTFDSFNI